MFMKQFNYQFNPNVYFGDPALFSTTTFLVDRFHNRNNSCNPIFSMKTSIIEESEEMNSQASEQLFSSLKRNSAQIAYVIMDNVFLNTRYFLACWNNLNTFT